MCDTFVALPDATLNGDVIFGKNSDRPRGEIQDVVTIPPQNYSPGELVNCTYLSIPQVPQTLGVILSKPRWIWGAEMGANDRGVVIGNEAVWTKEPYFSAGLLGMDLLRLALERSDTARSALDCIVELLEKYGQGGNCAENFALNYHNSFIIADPKEAWVLETAGQYWIAEHVTGGTRSISNDLSIRDRGDLRHPQLIPYAVEKGWCEGEKDFDFAEIFSEGGLQISSDDSREGRVKLLCQLNEGEFTIDTAQAILRDHKGNICMHGKFETTGSQISSLASHQCQHWFIEQPHPCEQEYRQKTFRNTAVSL